MTISVSQMASLKSLLLRAWRERWTEMQWSIATKRVLPMEGYSDNQQLSDLLLQQALVGSSPNMLVLSYLKHAVSSQMVTYTVVIKGIIKHTDLGPYCIKSLLGVVEDLAPHISARAYSEDALVFAKALLALVKWVMEMMHKCLQKLMENKLSTEYSLIVEKCGEVLKKMIDNMSNRAILYIARLEENETFRLIEQTEATIRGSLAKGSQLNISNQLIAQVDLALKQITKISNMPIESSSLIDVTHQNLNMSINVLVTLEAVLNATNDIQPLVAQIHIIESVQDLSRPVLFSELIRSCLLGMIDSASGQDELKWAAFVYLKLPLVLKTLLQQSKDPEKLKALEQGLELLLTYTSLLVQADSKCNCDCLQSLLPEFVKLNILSEQQMHRILSKRQVDSHRKAKPQEQPSPMLILRAEPTVTSILKTLDADYSKNQDALLGVLCHMMSGKSFELILAAAAATGKLQSFAVKLIKFNEFAKCSSGEGGKAPTTRALLFDISFLMLCHITQQYGTEIVSSCPESSNSFFAQWAVNCLPEDGKYKSLQILAPPDQVKVEGLLNQLNPGGELKYILTRWQEVCHNAPHAIQEALLAWEHGAITTETMKTIMDNLKSKMCCLPVVVSAQLCSYINIIDEDVRKKPLNLLYQLDKIVSPDSSNAYYAERSHLMRIILDKMVQGVLPAGSNRLKNPFCLPPTTTAYEMFSETIQEVFNNGRIDLKAMHKLEHLLNVTGSQWFIEYLVKELINHDRPEDLSKGVCLAFAVCHLDVENLTIGLIHHVIPSILQCSGSKLHNLIDPRGRALASLCVMCLTVTQRMRIVQKETHGLRRGRKRTRTDLEIEDQDSNEETRPSKMRKMPGESLSLHSEDFNFGDILNSKEEEIIPLYDTKDPLNKAMVNLFRLFYNILSQSTVSPKTGFIISFIEQLVKTGHQNARHFLQFMPMSMVSQLIKSSPGSFSTELLMALCDLTSHVGRKIASKAICQQARVEEKKSHIYM